MTIDEAIEKLLNKAEEQEYVSQIIVELHREESEREHKDACDACAADHRQLAEWLTDYEGLRAEIIDLRLYVQMLEEYREEAKRLLKAAVEDIHDILTSQRRITNNSLCFRCSYYLNCTCKEICETRCDLKQWRYVDEALKLIGGEMDD